MVQSRARAQGSCLLVLWAAWSIFSPEFSVGIYQSSGGPRELASKARPRDKSNVRRRNLGYLSHAMPVGLETLRLQYGIGDSNVQARLCIIGVDCVIRFRLRSSPCFP